MHCMMIVMGHIGKDWTFWIWKNAMINFLCSSKCNAQRNKKIDTPRLNLSTAIKNICLLRHFCQSVWHVLLSSSLAHEGLEMVAREEDFRGDRTMTITSGRDLTCIVCVKQVQELRANNRQSFEKDVRLLLSTFCHKICCSLC